MTVLKNAISDLGPEKRTSPVEIEEQFVAVRMNFMSNADTSMATTWRIG